MKTEISMLRKNLIDYLNELEIDRSELNPNSSDTEEVVKYQVLSGVILKLNMLLG